jgi:hypothetical protein
LVVCFARSGGRKSDGRKSKTKYYYPVEEFMSKRKAVKMAQQHHVMRYVEGEGPAKPVFSSFFKDEAETELQKRRQSKDKAFYYMSRY